MRMTEECYSACALYLLEHLQEEAPDYSLSKSLALLREGDAKGATFWANIYLAIVETTGPDLSMRSLCIH